MAIPDSVTAKSRLRSAMRQALRTHVGDSFPVRAAVDHWLLERPSLATVAIYSPLPGEVDLTPLTGRHPLVHWVYPKVSGQHLTFHPGHQLRPGAHGILEPREDAPEIPLHQIDAFICPGLAFDPSGHRLGRGRGYYDRVLAHARPGALKIGVCFPFQRVPDTFPEPHDVIMDEVLSG